jgi:hypothetical protein
MGTAKTPQGFSGHQGLKGVFGGSPDEVIEGFAHQAINRFFREDENRARPSIQGIALVFANEEDRIWFQGANGQGATFYNPVPSYLTPRLVCSIGGRIFTIDVQGQTGIVARLFDGNSRQFTHAWFGQGFQWLVIQDGIHPPIFWDGTNAPRRSDLAKNEMPIGSVMAFIHGRFVVASSDGKNSIYVGDIAYGGNVTTPNDILNFTEQTYWAEGGSFDTPINVGNIMGLYAMPFLDTGTGQNELVVACTAGFTSLDLSRPRTEWIDIQVQKVALIGDGLVSSHAFAGLNGDMFYRSQKGINTYRNARIEYSQRWNQTPISREVNYWLRPDRRDYLEFVPMVTWQNMMLCGSSPQIAKPNNFAFGFHRYCRGMVVFDADSMSTAGRDGQPVWHGMWSGIRPWAFAVGYIGNQERAFAFSYDRDGRNRLYEFTLTNGNDVFAVSTTLFQQRKIHSQYTTGMMGDVTDVTNAFAPKTFSGGVVEFSEVLNASEISIQFRPDGSPCWVQVDRAEPGCDCPTRPTCPDTLTAFPQYGRKYFQSVDLNKCLPGTSANAATFHHCQVRVQMVGSMIIDRLNIRFNLKPDGQIAECLGNNCEPITCCPAVDDYAYHIAPEGVNNEVPVPPETPVQPFVSTRWARLCCPDFRNICVNAQGQAQSTISQADADTKAQAAANANAQALLVCPECNPFIEDDQIIEESDVVDYSAFFVSGLYPELVGRPFRLVNTFNNEVFWYGHVDATGTLVAEQIYSGEYDGATNILNYLGPGSARMLIECGCNPFGTDVWPEPPPYYYG